MTTTMKPRKSEIRLQRETDDIVLRLKERKRLMAAAKVTDRLNSGAGVVLQTRGGEIEADELLDAGGLIKRPTADEVAEAVHYRLSVTDLFVEKAQYHLEHRAERYAIIGYAMYVIAVLALAFGAGLAVYRMFPQPDSEPELPPVVAPKQPVAAAPGPAAAAASTRSSGTDSTTEWIDLLQGFIVSFTGYGFIVLTAVAVARGARACLDQRERLLAKRHSLRQGRLYLHLTGGNVTIEEIERAFNWNHEQHNAFTNLLTDTKAPWGSVLEQIVKVTPELVKAGVTVAHDAAKKEPKEGEAKTGGK